MRKRNDFRFSVRVVQASRTVVLGFLLACGGGGGATSTPGGAQPSSSAATRDAHHEGHHHRFDDAAGWSKVFDDPARDEWQKPTRVVELVAATSGMTVADIGAGTGYFEPHLSRAVGSTGKVIAEDVEPDMVKWLEDRAKRDDLANVQALLGTADDPNLAAASVDRILIVDTWHHVDDRRAFAKKLALALKPGGAVVIVDFTLESPHGPPRRTRVAPEAVAADLASAGLTTNVIKDAGLPHQYVVRGERR